jgi:hypothetical protein
MYGGTFLPFYILYSNVRRRRLTVDNNNNNNENLVFNSNTESEYLRCRGCNCAIFSLHKEQIINEKTNTSSYEIVCDCAECLSNLRMRYNDEDDNSGSSSAIISVKFKESQLIALDNFLDIMKKQFASIVTAAETNISENEKKKYASKLIQVEQLMKLIKSTAHD